MAPPSEPDDELFTFSDVYLLTDGPDGRVAIPHLELALARAGITLAKPDAEVAWSSGWDELATLTTEERSLLSHGREGLVVLVVERNGRSHRFVVPTEDPALLMLEVRTMAQRHALRTSRPPRATLRSFNVVLGVAALASVALLVLSAAHVVHW
ncbi:MAG TPA: hypothetical protein VL961_13435 [Acidimicrobiales bacterium]|nr:hypothetical protein [Acidimicrobiales bacterium]